MLVNYLVSMLYTRKDPESSTHEISLFPIHPNQMIRDKIMKNDDLSHYSVKSQSKYKQVDHIVFLKPNPINVYSQF